MKFEGTKIVYETGDWVTIQKTLENWNHEMDVMNGKTVQITGTKEDFPGSIDITFEGSGLWHYTTRNNHFRPATQQEIDKAVREVKEIFKVNDWVYVCVRGKSADSSLLFGKVFQIKEIKDMGNAYVTGYKHLSDTGNEFGIYLTELRRATPEEIAKAKEPVKFNSGDWVTCIELAEGMRRGSGWELGLTFQITKVEKYSDGDIYFGGKNTNGVYIQSIRAATAKEIQDAKDSVIKIGDHKIVIDGGVLVVGCKSFSRSQVSDLYRVMRDMQINTIKIEATEVRIDVVTKIYDRMCS